MNKAGLLLFFFVLVGCNQVYHEFYKDFPKGRWQKNTLRIFDISIAEDGKYNIDFELSHAYQYPFSNLPLSIALIYPDGKQDVFQVDVPIADASGTKIGECALDICDLNFNIKNGINLTQGNYKVVISNAFSEAYVPDIIGIGLAVTHQ
jgi:gliding motility-associated lipoprotein GldH